MRSSRNKLDQFKRDARNAYRFPTEKIDTESIPMAMQYRGCGKWLAQNKFKNGKLLARGCSDCEKERDNRRKRKLERGWVKDSDVRKYCLRIPTGEMCLQLGISPDTLKEWRVTGLLPKGIYWVTLPNSDRIIWIRDLVRDWVVNRDSQAHQRAISRYLASLPSSSEYKPTKA